MSTGTPAEDDRIQKLRHLRIDRAGDSRRTGSGAWRWIAVVLVLLLAVVAWPLLRSPDAVVVRTVVAQASVLRDIAGSSVLDATGYVTARRQATVSSEITGKIREVLIEEGMTVDQDQILAYLDDTTERAELDLAQAQLESTRAILAETRAQLTEARQNLTRTSELATRKLASQKELDAAEAQASTLAARLETGRENVKVAERTVALQKQRIDEFIIRAPFAGVVIAKNAQPGEMISPISAGGGFTRTGICTIVDMESLEIEVDVNEAYIQRVRSGQTVTAVLDAYPDWKIPSTVIAIVPAADRQKATVKVRIGFHERDPRILPDMGVKVSFLEEDPEPSGQTGKAVVLVPKSALAQRDNGYVVWLAIDDRAQSRVVRVTGFRDDKAQVLAGVEAGQRVILEPPDTLTDGIDIDVRN